MVYSTSPSPPRRSVPPHPLLIYSLLSLSKCFFFGFLRQGHFFKKNSQKHNSNINKQAKDKKRSPKNH